MTPKFTPGPWIAADCIHPEIVIRADGFGKITSLYPDGKGIGRANARLISAAPDLYEALVRLLPMATDSVSQYGGSPEADEDVAFARAALAKAIGGAL